MRAEQEKLNSRLNGMNEEEKDLLIRRLLEENSEMEARLEIANSAAAELAVQYQQIKDENAALKEEKKELLRQNRSLTDQLQKRKKDLFGRKSEQSSGIIDSFLMRILKTPSMNLHLNRSAGTQTKRMRHSAPLLQPPSKQQSTLTASKIPADIRLAENGRRISIPFRQGRSMTSMLMP